MSGRVHGGLGAQAPARTVPEAGSSAALLAALSDAAAGDERRLGTLDRLRDACDHLVGKGRCFSLRDIEAHCRSTFGAGPRAQSISNNSGLHAYVEARRREAAFPQRRKLMGTLDRSVEEIPDPDTRARMRALAEEHRMLQKRYHILTQGLAHLSPPLDLDVVFGGKRDSDAVTPSGLRVKITEEQVRALRGLVAVLRDPVQLQRLGLEVDAGDVVGRGMRETLIEQKGLEALEALLKGLGGLPL